MSFGFVFDDDEIDDEYKEEVVDGGIKGTDCDPLSQVKDEEVVPAQRHDLKDLLSALPPRISYSKVDIPLHKDQKIELHRRDLFDARFQLINDGDGEAAESIQNVKSPAELHIGSKTDLIPGVYEGGFKTWECSLDLVAILESQIRNEGGDQWLERKHITEIGCGTALPSMFLLSQMIKSESECNCVLELCDFNEQVLRLVTLPNMLLTWYFSRSEMGARESSGELEISPDVVHDFVEALNRRQISLRFYSGSWQTLHNAGAFDTSNADGSLVLTSETIYSLDSLPDLVDTLEKACHHSLETRMEKTRLGVEAEAMQMKSKHLCLVAAKMLYFGVGGGVEAFSREVKRHHADCKTLWQSQQGVARAILEVNFK